jgi:hypothetical protein
MKKYLSEISCLVLLAFINLLVGCQFYYKVNRIQPVSNEAVGQATLNKYVILHQGNEAWHLSNVTLDNDKNELLGTIESLPSDHYFYTKTKVPGANKYKPHYQNPTIEVHIYVVEHAIKNEVQAVVPLSAIEKIDVYEPDKGSTAASFIFGGIGIVVGAMVIVGVIVALTKSSCPLVYIYDGSAYHFTGEMFGGAVNSSAERDDYMPLPGIKPADGKYQLKISNELLERQYTNLAELIVVEHPDNLTVLVDKHGSIQTMSKLHSPTLATDGNNQECSKAMEARDSLCYLFNQGNKENAGMSSLLLSFDKPKEAHSAKLVLNLKNSYWLDYIYGKFNEQFGTFFNEFNERQKKVPPEKNLQWSLDQGIPLSVYVETGEGWQYVDYINTVGPLASRDVVIPVELSGVSGDKVKIKLECGFMFWEVDYAAIDYSANKALKTDYTPVFSAYDEKGKDVAVSLLKTDKKYLYQPSVGNEAVLTFVSGITGKDMNQSVFFHNRGYYEYIRNYSNKPDMAYLKTFREKGAFAKFSKTHYDNFVNDKDFIAKAFGNEPK